MKRLLMGAAIAAIFSVTYLEHWMLSKTPLADTQGLGDYTFSKQTVVNWNGKRDLKRLMQAYFHEGNPICNLSGHSTLVNITFGCKRLYETSGLGSGNFIAGFYAIRLAALIQGNVDVNIHCPDALQQQDSLLLPWMTGHFPASVATKEKLESIMQQYNVPKDDVCGTIDQCPIGILFEEIRYDLRRMAVSLVGIPNEHHPSHTAVKQWLSQHNNNNSKPYRMQLAISETPLYPNMELDDAIVHFRCGDLMSSRHPRFGFVKYNAFASRISPNATRIGIVTQPFETSAQNRAWDSSAEKRRRCKTVVLDFQQHLQTKFPNAHVRIHNSPKETIALTYARMIMANQSIAGISTFGVFSSIASYGTGHIRLPDNQSSTNQWLLNPPLDKLTNDLVLMEDPNILMVQQVQKLWEENDGEQKILSWFRDSSIRY